MRFRGFFVGASDVCSLTPRALFSVAKSAFLEQLDGRISSCYGFTRIRAPSEQPIFQANLRSSSEQGGARAGSVLVSCKSTVRTMVLHEHKDKPPLGVDVFSHHPWPRALPFLRPNLLFMPKIITSTFKPSYFLEGVFSSSSQK